MRRALHAGTWYDDDAEALADEIQGLLAAQYAEGALVDPTLKAVIAPHAGLRYSGAVAARVYACVDPAAVRRLVLIGPSHHGGLRGAGIPAVGVAAYATPLGDLPLDQASLGELRSTGLFAELPMSLDEREHSLELQLPFLAQLFLHSAAAQGRRGVLGGDDGPVSLVPVLVGSASARDEAQCGAALAPLLRQEGTLFVVSSDFCHWGAQFNYMRRGRSELAETYREGPHPENAEIEGLDREGMALIAAQDAEGFRAYLARLGNTICGRHPILVMLEALKAGGGGAVDVRFVKYAQSSAMGGMPPPTNSSVSYACACVTPTLVPPPSTDRSGPVTA